MDAATGIIVQAIKFVQMNTGKLVVDPAEERLFDGVDEPFVSHIFKLTSNNANTANMHKRRRIRRDRATDRFRHAPVLGRTSNDDLHHYALTLQRKKELERYRNLIMPVTKEVQPEQLRLRDRVSYNNAFLNGLQKYASQYQQATAFTDLKGITILENDWEMNKPSELGMPPILKWFQQYTNGTYTHDPVVIDYHNLLRRRIEATQSFGPRILVKLCYSEPDIPPVAPKVPAPVKTTTKKPAPKPKKKRKSVATKVPAKKRTSKRRKIAKSEAQTPDNMEEDTTVESQIDENIETVDAPMGLVFDSIPDKSERQLFERQITALHQGKYCFWDVVSEDRSSGHHDTCNLAMSIRRYGGEVLNVPRSMFPMEPPPSLGDGFDPLFTAFSKINVNPEADIHIRRSPFTSLPSEMEDRKSPQKVSAKKGSQWRRLWAIVVKRELPKGNRKFQTESTFYTNQTKKLSGMVVREIKRRAQRNLRGVREMPLRARRLVREMQSYWKKLDKEIGERRKVLEKERAEKRKREEEIREQKRQQRKLEFLLGQTEIFSHFISKKMGLAVTPTPEMAFEDEELQKSTEDASKKLISQHTANKTRLEAEYNSLRGIDHPIESKQLLKLQQEPRLFKGKLKTYQLKGLNWLANLYDQGINGILADEMGLGKTIQSIAFLAYLCEVHDIWGPFLVVAPNTTLLQWISEINRFCPALKTIPYWGDQSTRKVIRRYWNPKNLYKEDASFHVCVTSYKVFVNDERYFQKLQWQYMILDEAQAIKNASSQRWNSLLRAKCRNRLLLTGTPIQNSMGELWALLHFIMPTLFDSHQEFSEWFTRANADGSTDLHQVQRLHMILKPFMLRRVKRDVEHEMAPKIEVQVNCSLSRRQREMYQGLKERLPIDEIMDSSNAESSQENLINFVMQFRKVCNHPEIFERRFTKSPAVFKDLDYTYLSSDDLRKSVSGRQKKSFSFEEHQKDIVPVWHNPITMNIPLQVMDAVDYKSFALQSTLSIWHSDIIHERFQGQLRAADLSAAEVTYLFRAQESLMNLWEGCLSLQKHSNAKKNILWSSNEECFENSRWVYTQVKCSMEHAVAPPVEITVLDRRRMNYLELQRDALWERSKLIGLQRRGINPLVGVHIPSSLQFDQTNIGKSFALRELKSASSTLLIPGFRRLLADSGKLLALDTLLTRLKKEGHRVLIFSQMTKMINILEEYMRFRGHSVFRLDGQTDVVSRREMVTEFQENDTFAFLLSTRAGGLGITLTAADTVIFYDSDWNPSMDAQAMDRVHRIGQTKQVHVYRLVCRGTIEEKILRRAQHKHNIQATVYSGGFKLPSDAGLFKGAELRNFLLESDNGEVM